MPAKGSEAEIPKEVLEQLEKAREMADADKETPKDTKVEERKLTQDEGERLRKKLESL